MSIVNQYVFDICFKFHVLTLVTFGLKQQSTSNWTSTSDQAWWFWHFSLRSLLGLASRHRNPQCRVKEGIQTKWIFQYFFHRNQSLRYLSFFVGNLGKKNETHIKKPLNAFMLYMKEMRPVVQAECTLKESAAINQLLGRRVRPPILLCLIFDWKWPKFQWHGLSREEQAKYYEKARVERQKHMQMYPHWNARDNYRFGSKKKKRKRERSVEINASSNSNHSNNSLKKCRARYGLDQHNMWCKPCR